MEAAPLAGLALRGPVGVVGERAVSAGQAAVVVHARAVGEAARRAGGAIEAWRCKAEAAPLDARLSTAAWARSGIICIHRRRVVVGPVESRFVDPVDVGVGTRPGRLSMKWET